MIIHPKHILHLLRIHHILLRNGLDEILFAEPPLRPIRYLYYILPWGWFNPRKKLPRAVRIRRALEELGPIYIKFGQILSTRRDLLPEDIINELAKLQDNVPPFPTQHARQIIERTYNKKIEDLFYNFDDTPLAAASIAQVHSAQRKDGQAVIIKIIRPGILPGIRRDLALLKQMAALAEYYSSEARRLRPCTVVADYEKAIYDELDLRREAGNASQLRRMFQNSSSLYVPSVHWELVRHNILVMERIHGIRISDIEQLQARGVNMRKLAERGVEIFFTQVFTHNFFHADMHPGNIFVNADAPEDPKYIAVDFGIMGTLTAKDRRYLAENFLAFFNRDYRRVAQLHLDSGWVPGHTTVEEFEAAIRTVCEPIFERPLNQISFGRFLLTLFQTAQRFDLYIQPQLVLLQKTLLNIEGLGRQLYPELDLWVTAKPFLEKTIRQETCLKMLLDKLPGEKPEWLYKFPEMPAQLLSFLEKAVEGSLQTTLPTEQLQTLQKQLQHSNRRHYYTSLGTTLLLAAAVLHGLHAMPLYSWLLGIPGSILLLFAWPRS